MSKKRKQHPHPSPEAAAPKPDVRAREEAEPVAAKGAVPAILIVLLGLLLFWGDVYIMENGADLMGKTGPFPAQVFHPYRSFSEVESMHPKTGEGEALAKGRQVYNTYCVACHQPNGAGAAGQFPPLAASEWVLAPKPDRLIRIVLNGLSGPIEVKGAQFNNVMLPWRDALSDQQVADVLSYIRNEWGNKAPFVKPDEVKAIRDATADKGVNWTAEELKAIPDN